MEISNDITQFDALVGRIFSIEDRTIGNPEKDYIVRYRGCLRSEDSEKAYDDLTAALAPYNVTPLFRWDEKRHAILIIPGKPKPKPSNPKVNILMFALTLIAVLFAGVVNSGEPIPADPLEAFLAIFRLGWPFTVSILGILLTHEFGHYLMSRHHKVHATLPYFVPFLPPFGTMGAVIVMKEQPKNRRQLLDIGLAGPLAGLIVAIPVVILGLMLSRVDALPAHVSREVGVSLEGNSILYLFLKFLVFGRLLPAPADFAGVPAWFYWLRYFFTARPLPLGGIDVALHPVAFAGWAGLLVTAFNLLPAGQLDGGHMIYVLLGKARAQKLYPFILGIIALLGFVYVGWWLWFVLIFFLGRAYDDPLDQITPLDPTRRALAVLAIIIFFLIFIPVPFSIIGG